MNSLRVHISTVVAVAWQWGIQLLIFMGGLLSPGPAQAQILPSDISITCDHFDTQWSPFTLYADELQQFAVGDIVSYYQHQLQSDRLCHGEVSAASNYWIMRIQTGGGLSYRLPAASPEAGIGPVMGPDGEMYSVYQVPGVPGLGYIVQLLYHPMGKPLWIPVNLSAGQEGVLPDPFVYSEYPGQKHTDDPAGFYLSINLWLVKTADTPLPAPATVSFEVLQHDVLVQLGLVASATPPPAGTVPTLASPSIHTWNSSSFTLTIEETWIPPPVPTCTTPVVGPILLDKARLSDFNGIGTWAKDTDFELVFSNCDPNVTALNYTFAAGGAPSPLPYEGVLPLVAPSTAQGVGVQVLEKNPGWYGTDDYVASDVSGFGYAHLPSMAPGSDLILPMRARYLQLDDTIQTGSVHAVLTFVVQFETGLCVGTDCIPMPESISPPASLPP